MHEVGLDRVLLTTVIVLSLVGIITVYSSSYWFALNLTEWRDANLFFRHHIVRVSIGFIALVFFLKVRESLLRVAARPMLLLGLGLLILVLVPSPLRLVVRGSARWLKIGPVVFQPSEPAKIALIIYLADLIARKGYQIREFTRGFLPPFIVVGAFVVLIAKEPNLGTALMVLLIGCIMLFAGGARIHHILLGVSSTLTGFILYMWKSGYNWARLVAYFDSSSGGATGYQLQQSLIAIGAGGLKGVGIGMSNQKYLFVPDAFTDFVFSITAEEIGFLGVVGLIALFSVFVYRGLMIARRAGSVFSSLVACGVTMLVGVYFCAHIGICTGILPTIGLPLPFLSYGGSSIMMLLASCGMLLAISKNQAEFRHLGTSRMRGLLR